MSNTTKKKSIMVNGHRLKRTKDGRFNVASNRLGAFDLTTLPVDTALTVLPRQPLAFTDPAWVVLLRIPKQGVVEAFGMHCRWTAGFVSEGMYIEIAKRLFEENAAVHQDLMCFDAMPSPFGLSLTFMLMVKGVVFDDIEVEVNDRVRTILQPLLDFDRDTSDDAKRRFGI